MSYMNYGFEDVRRAYPGNDPAGAENKRQAIITQIRFNETLVDK